MNKQAIFLFAAAAVVIVTSSCLHSIKAISQYDSDGFTIFPTKSSDYMSGYRAGVIQADKDVQLLNIKSI